MKWARKAINAVIEGVANLKAERQPDLAPADGQRLGQAEQPAEVNLQGGVERLLGTYLTTLDLVEQKGGENVLSISYGLGQVGNLAFQLCYDGADSAIGNLIEGLRQEYTPQLPVRGSREINIDGSLTADVVSTLERRTAIVATEYVDAVTNLTNEMDARVKALRELVDSYTVEGNHELYQAYFSERLGVLARTGGPIHFEVPAGGLARGLLTLANDCLAVTNSPEISGLGRYILANLNGFQLPNDGKYIGPIDLNLAAACMFRAYQGRQSSAGEGAQPEANPQTSGQNT